ncbi:MAG: S41 family peptidase [Planctomycetales bacterium]|nr:S41 family peptidase [Planctomycetales bacterium]
MRLWFSRLAGLILLTLGCLMASAVQSQELRIVEPESRADLRTILVHGDELSAARQWRELTEHYKHGVEAFPNSDVVRRRFYSAQAREDVERRYADASFRKVVATLSDREAIDLYSELLAKVQSHYVDEPQWTSLVNRGMVFALAALQAERLQQLAPGATAESFSDLQSELSRLMQTRPTNDVREAREAAWFAGQLAKQRTGLPAPALMLEFVAGATAALDTYSSFLTPDQLDEVFSQIEGNFVGLGVELETLADSLKIVNVIAGGPASLAGVKVNDRIVEIDGQTVVEMGGDLAANALRGEEGSTVSIVVVREQQVTQRLSIVRRVVDVPSVVDAKILDARDGVAYFKLTSFQKSTSRDVDTALWSLHKQGMRSLIVDLRGNPGGLLDASVQVADKFLTSGAIVSTRGRTEKFEFRAHDEGTWGIPLVVLIDRDSASASEILAGALRDHQRAQVVGTRSYGKGSVQGIFPLSIGKAGVRLTTAKFYSPSGRAISHNGVLPTTQVHTTAKSAGLAPADDAALLSAVQAARNQLAQRRARPVTQSVGLNAR